MYKLLKRINLAIIGPPIYAWEETVFQDENKERLAQVADKLSNGVYMAVTSELEFEVTKDKIKKNPSYAQHLDPLPDKEPLMGSCEGLEGKFSEEKTIEDNQ